MVDPKTQVSYAPILLDLASFLKVKLNTFTQNKTARTYYRIEASSTVSLKILVAYLEKHFYIYLNT